jgi:fructosamine-3-kinase
LTLPDGVRDAVAIAGGDINDAFRVRLADGREAFVKTRADAQPGEYAAEAAGLAWLAEPGALRTPAVLEVGDGHLALAWLEEGSLDAAGAEELGRGLALTHRAGARCFGDPGLGGEARIGPLLLPNEPAEDWGEFYAGRRLQPLVLEGSRSGRVSASCAAAVERVCAKIGELVGPAEPPARLHGDLWRGNVFADRAGRPWLIDPFAYGGHREVDLAMLRLFGAPSERVFSAYTELAPLADGWRERVELYQLLPLLIHAVLFGGGYSASAERAARAVAG